MAHEEALWELFEKWFSVRKVVDTETIFQQWNLVA